MTIAKKLEFCSIFSYCPRDDSKEGLLAKRLVNRIKGDKIMKVRKIIFESSEKEIKEIIREIPASQYVAESVRKFVDKGYFTSYFKDADVILVPIPRSTPIKKGQLWPSYQIAMAMEKEKLGIVKTALLRIKPVQKSSLAPPSRRPKPKDHYESMRVNKLDLDLNDCDVLLVDDVVTRGHTFMGAYWRLIEAFPKVNVKSFAAVQTISNKSEFKKYIYPVEGIIYYRKDEGDCIRRTKRTY